MDKLKATMLLAEIKGYLTAGNPVWDVDEIAEACDMAIEALKCSEKLNGSDLISRSDALAEFKDGRDVYDIMESIEEIPSATCDDCIWHVCNYNKIDWDGEDGYISKRDTIDAVLELNTDGRVSWQDAVIDMLDALPSAESKTGEWIKVIDEDSLTKTVWHYECDQCGAGRWEKGQRYCQNCGARMNGGEEE